MTSFFFTSKGGFFKIMCGRFTLTSQEQEIIEAFNVEDSHDSYEPSYNTAPSQTSPVVFIHPHTGKRTLEKFEWGLIPSWAKTPSPDYNTINARAENLSKKPAFRKSLSSRRCLIPVDGFYEWSKDQTPKQPYRITKKDGSLFALAGLWDEWVSPDQSQKIRSFTIITTDANELIKPLHTRMPVIIGQQDYEAWLEIRPQYLLHTLELLRPYPSEELTMYPINPIVNNSRNNSPECIKPVNP